MNHEQYRTADHNWVVWRLQNNIQTWSGQYNTRGEAENAIKQLAKLFPKSTYKIRFKGQYKNVESAKKEHDA